MCLWGACVRGLSAHARALRSRVIAETLNAEGRSPPPPPPLVLSGHAASFTPYKSDTDG